MMQDPIQLESCLVSGATGRPSKVESVETGIFSRSSMKFVNLDFVYVFDQPLATNQVDKLKTSLEQLLDHYPTMAGRVQGNQVLLNNKGAAFEVQAMPRGSSIRDIPQDPPTGKPFCHIPIPSEQIEGKAPLLSITVTKYDDGWTLGIVANHLVTDAWTFAIFVKDWSEIYNSREIEKVQYQLPSVMFEMHQTKEEADEAALTDLHWIPMPWLKQKILKGLVRYVVPRTMKNDPRLGKTPERLVLRYSASQLKQLKESAESVAQTWISTNEALMTHLWKLMMDAAELTSEQRSKIGASVTVNLRSKLPGISPRLIGNVVTCAMIETDLSDNGEIALERQIHDKMRSALTEEKLQTAMMVLNRPWIENDPGEFYQTKNTGDLWFDGIPGVLKWNWQLSNPYFHVDFGGGPPQRGILWNWQTPVTVMPSPDGGADVYIDTTLKGPVSWKRPPTKWAMVTVLCGVLALSGSIVLLKVWTWPSALAWLAGFGLLTIGAKSYAKKDMEESQQIFHDFVKVHAHRGLKATESC